MPRAVKEWIGKSDDSAPSEKCKLRILDRQGRKCALTGKEFTAQEKPDFDHVTPLWLGGANRESNLQAIHRDPHKRKTAAEASVRAKVNASAAKHLGITRPAGNLQGQGFRKTAKALKASRHSPLPAKQLFTKESVR